jgi:hypothetical protein
VIKSTLLNELRCWKVENLDDERSDENKNEEGANANGLDFVFKTYASCNHTLKNVQTWATL